MLQLAQLEDEAGGQQIPYHITLPQSQTRISTHRALTFTGHRLLNTFVLRQSTTSAASGEAAAHDATSGAGDAGMAEAADGEAVEVLVQTMQGKAPTKLTAREICGFARACSYFMADAITHQLLHYVQPALAEAPLPEARTLLDGACVHVTMRWGGTVINWFCGRSMCCSSMVG